MQRLRHFFTLALAGAVVVGCSDELTSPTPLPGPNEAISDGATGGINSDVFFLPPLVKNPVGSSFFDAGQFNPNLASAVIRVCRISGDACAETVASFGAGQATGPIQISSSDEHYLALWHTDESNPALIAGEPYRIEVFADGDLMAAPLAWADVAVAATGRDLRNLNTAETIALLDGRTLPIKVRFENGVRCATSRCEATRVDADGGTLVIESGEGALVLQEGWLPPGVPEVTVTVQWEPTALADQCVQREGFVGAGLLAQTTACLHITTDPVLTPGEATGIQEPAFVFICKPSPLGVPEDLEDYLQIIKADAGRPLQPLRDVSHSELIALGFTPTCPDDGTPIGSLPSNSLLRFASTSVRAVTDFVARAFEVRSLQAIDLGQGGEIIRFDAFSRFTLGVRATVEDVSDAPATAPATASVDLAVRVLGKTHHGHEDEAVEGISDIDVQFTVTGGDGTLSDPESEGESTSLTGHTGEDGIAGVTLLVAEGENTVTAVAVVDGDPVSDTLTFTITGTAPLVGSLRFVQQPTSTVSGETMSPPVVIEALDASGARLTTEIVRITIGHPPDQPEGCQILQTSTLAINGLATFENIQVGGVCDGVRMGAAGGGGGYDFPILLSEPFDILPIGPSGEVTLDAVELSSTILVIGGGLVSYSALMTNGTAESLSGVLLQGWIEQPTATRAAGFTMVRCAAELGVLPPGQCTEQFTLIASNTTSGSGTLTPGVADAVIELRQGELVLDSVRIRVELVAP